MSSSDHNDLYYIYNNGIYNVEISKSDLFVDIITFPSEQFWQSAQTEIEFSLEAYDCSYQDNQMIRISYSTRIINDCTFTCNYLLYRSNGKWIRRIDTDLNGASNPKKYSYVYEDFDPTSYIKKYN